MKEVPQESLVSRINDVLATKITVLVGSIWAFYAFVIFGLTPILWPEYETQILYWSNFLQLVFLPVITVGTAILNRDSEKRALEDHKTIRSEFNLLKEVNGSHREALREIATGVHELLARSGAADGVAEATKPRT
ncbi:MAG: hypothetical protein ACRECX_02985 [Methyloceanibacter sp.]|uniref:hypothetical protein n=1 Tax=Methyloceanibacter sp. TaxID=1965321 RepID=UPI003D6D4826